MDAGAARRRAAGRGHAGREGALLATPDGVLRMPAMDVPMHSSVGAGDAFLAATTLALARGATPVGGAGLGHRGRCDRDRVCRDGTASSRRRGGALPSAHQVNVPASRAGGHFPAPSWPFSSGASAVSRFAASVAKRAASVSSAILVSAVRAVAAMRASSPALAHSSCEGRRDRGTRSGLGGERIDITWVPGKVPDARFQAPSPMPRIAVLSASWPGASR